MPTRACRILTQPDFPGWVHWLSRGATGLWENWDGQASRNHIMFGDIAAWMMQYLAGIVPDEKHPGFSEVTLRPLPAAGVDRVKASHRAPSGQISVEWERDGGKFRLTARIGDGVPGRVELPGRQQPDACGRRKPLRMRPAFGRKQIKLPDPGSRNLSGFVAHPAESG